MASYSFKGVHFCKTDNNRELDLIDFSQNLTMHSTKYCMDSFSKLMQQYPEISKLTISTTLEQDILSLVCTMFDYLLKIPDEKIRMLEIGSFFGCSSYFAAKALKLLKNDPLLYCCDHWEGANGGIEDLSGCVDTLSYFRGVMRYLGVSKQIVPLAGDSAVCLEAFRDNYFDMIFIDGGHRYKTVCSDINSAIRLVKPGGLIMGHDCECFFPQLPENIKDKKIGPEEIADGPFHTGVIFALENIFHGNYQKPVTDSLVWVKKIAQTDKSIVLFHENSDCNQIQRLLNLIAEKLNDLCSGGEESELPDEAASVGKLYVEAEKKIIDLKKESLFRKTKYLIGKSYEYHLSYCKALADGHSESCAGFLEKERSLLSQAIESNRQEIE